MATKRAKKRSEGEQLEQMVRLRRGLPVLDQFSNERSVACVFRVEDLTRTRSHFRFHLSAALGTADVGFDCRVVRRVPSFYEVQPRGQRGGVEVQTLEP